MRRAPLGQLPQAYRAARSSVLLLAQSDSERAVRNCARCSSNPGRSAPPLRALANHGKTRVMWTKGCGILCGLSRRLDRFLLDVPRSCDRGPRDPGAAAVVAGRRRRRGGWPSRRGLARLRLCHRGARFRLGALAPPVGRNRASRHGHGLRHDRAAYEGRRVARRRRARRRVRLALVSLRRWPRRLGSQPDAPIPRGPRSRRPRHSRRSGLSSR